MRLLKLFLALFLSHLRTTASQDALALFGGEYPDGYFDNEVEVWSHSSSCNLEIPSTPDSFRDAPGVGVLDDKIYVCGGHRIGTNHTTSTCDVYSLTDKTWSQGPSFNNHPEEVHLATMGSKLIAAYALKNMTSRGWNDQLVITFLSSESPEWSILTVIGCDPYNCNPSPYDCQNCWSYLRGIGQVDENHIGLVEGSYYRSNYSVHVVNVETGKHVMVDTLDNASCDYGFVFNDLFTCQFNRGFYSLTYNDEDYHQHEWTFIGNISDIDPNWPLYGPFVEVDGMLTSLGSLNVGLIYWKEELEDEEWKTAEVEIPRFKVGWTILNCQ